MTEEDMKALINAMAAEAVKARSRIELLEAEKVVAQAREQALRAALDRAAQAAAEARLPDGYQWGRDAMESFHVGARQAAAAVRALAPLAAPTDNTALREFCLKVAEAIHFRDVSRSREAIVDALLRGEK